MTPEQREQLKQAAMKATPGPWVFSKYGSVMDAEKANVIVSSESEFNDKLYITAADPAAILSLIAQVEALTVPQWISVEDQLPSDEIQVLGYSSRRNLVSTCYHCTDEGGGGWGSAVLYGSEITHWMELPAAPTIPAIPETKEGA